MIILRQNKEKDPVVLYHITKRINLPSILKEGLKTRYFKQREENKYLGIEDTGLIYLVRDKGKLVKPFRPDKDVILEITIPLVIFTKMNKLFGDPEWYLAQKVDNWEETKAEALRKAYPGRFGNMTTEEIMREATPLEYQSPENTVCIKDDIAPEYIKTL